MLIIIYYFFRNFLSDIQILEETLKELSDKYEYEVFKNMQCVI